TFSVVQGFPPFTAAGVSPFEGDGRYTSQVIYSEGDTLEDCLARTTVAGQSLAKRTIDWIRCFRALHGNKPISIFWQNFGNTQSDGETDYSNSVSFLRCGLDVLKDNGTINSLARRQNPFSANARAINRAIGEAAAQFLDDNLTED